MQSRYSRRSVLRASVVLGGAVVLPRVQVLGDEGTSTSSETIGVGIIGAGGRGNELAGPFSSAAGTKIVAVADPDSTRAEKLAGKYQATAYADLRQLLEDPAVDVVAIATCNHWHCLAAVLAMQAGKDVYVEKPLGHNQWEGRQVVEAARKYDRIVQVGTQQRSDPMQVELKKFLHNEGALGAIQHVQTNRLGVRGPIGRRRQPLPIPATVDYNLWLGPALDEPLLRDQLHYDWHWDWNTGNGEMGNWGVHVLDDVRNVAYQDSVSTPRSILAIGGRVAWNDAGETPNVHYAMFETDSFPTLIALSNLATGPNEKKQWSARAGRPLEGPGSGYVVACEGGYLLGQRGHAKAVDQKGKTIREFRGGDMVPLHVQNFLTAVRAHDSSILNAEVEVGHHSTGWCNLANIGFRAASSGNPGSAAEIDTPEAWQELLSGVDQQLKPFGLSRQDLAVSPVLNHNPKTEQFEGAHAEQANAFLRRQYRDGFAFPDV